ncbi:hypothetical protein [Frateuria sp. YIM B11624]|uniref:hypothetical protein n=1 Tax=Frateuria sp. YIM B11624 TaxID=3143185 RepID=UPI003C726C5F
MIFLPLIALPLVLWLASDVPAWQSANAFLLYGVAWGWWVGYCRRRLLRGVV